MLPRHATALLATPVLLLLAACGGKVVVESGGQGGSSSSVSTSSATATAVTATSSTNDVGQAEAVTATGSPTSASGPPPGCDQQGDCGDESNGCIGCALNSICEPAYVDCLSGDECAAFAECTSQCSDPSCLDECAAAFPNGAEQYNTLISCVFCDACLIDCGGGPVGCL